MVLNLNVLSVLALHYICDLSKVFPSSCPITAGNWLQLSCDPELEKWREMDARNFCRPFIFEFMNLFFYQVINKALYFIFCYQSFPFFDFK